MEKNKVGQPPAYTPSELLDKAKKYFEYAEHNPVMIEVPSKVGPMEIAKRYPVNIYDFCRFAEIHRDTFYEYKSRKEYSDTCAYIDTYIKAGQFSGAITGEFNSNFVSRINDLAERQAMEHSGAIAIPSINVTVVKSGPELASSEKDVK